MKSQQEKAAYAARVIRTFLDETCGPYDWDDFISCSLRDPLVDSIRLRASAVDLPVDADGQRELLALADEADRLVDADQCWGLSNPGPDTLYVWLEPWADEIEVPVRSTITFNPSGGPDDCPLGQVDWTTDHLVVWATAQRVAVSLDGVLQHSGSAVIAVPDGLTKGTLGILFADQPSASLGGAPSDPIGRTSWWQLIRRRLGL